MSNEREWWYPHAGDMPSTNRALAVLVALKDGTFYPDIGRYYGKDGWNLQAWSGSTVVAWTNIPDFKDHVPVIDHDAAVSSPRESSK